MPPSGSGKRKILIVGEAPGEKEDDQGVHFVGKTGQKLRNLLRKLAVDPNRDCIFTNALICHPPGNKIPDKRRLAMIDACRPNLIKTVQKYDPSTIILLGKTAVTSYIGHVWKEEVGSVERWAGYQIPCRKPNAWICPTWHPSFVERTQDQVLERMWEDHITAAVAIKGRPWDQIPDYSQKVTCILDPDEATAFILAQKPTALAFDFETNMLKPDSRRGRIVCCSICFDGKTTIAFPWHGNAIKATLKLLWDPKILKVGFNTKFENRWVLAKYGKPVVGWAWCGMLAAHVLDNRPHITSLKFQAFVRFGQPSYDSVVKPYLKSKGAGGNSENRIAEVSINRILEYNALDALLEYKVAKQQMREMGVKFNGLRDLERHT